MSPRTVFTSFYTGALLAFPGILAWMTGHPFVFPSVGPSALILAMIFRGDPTSGRRVVGGHVVGVVAGLGAYHLFAAGIAITTVSPPLSIAQLRLSVSAVVSVILTVAGMQYTGTVHPPACATTLIVSLGLLATPVEGLIIVGSVTLMFGVHQFAKRYVVSAPDEEPSPSV